MTSVHPPVNAGGGSGDAVVGAMGGLGEAIDCTNLRSFSLEGPHVLWLVVDGAMDLFAIDIQGSAPTTRVVTTEVVGWLVVVCQ